VDVFNKDNVPHEVVVNADGGGAFRGENRGWADATLWPNNLLLAGLWGPAKRVLLYGTGADAYSRRPDGRPDGCAMLTSVWNLEPGEKKSGWIIRPYQATLETIGDLETTDWQKEWDKAENVWKSLLTEQPSRLFIPDIGVHNGFLAALADIFIMREPIEDGLVGATPGTDHFRCVNSVEPLLGVIALDQLGLHDLAVKGAKLSLRNQGEDGDWNDPDGWAHLMWCTGGIKSRMAMEHYRLTRDREFLEWVYPRMLAEARFTQRMRQHSRVPFEGEKPTGYGLMPRGMGDCGLFSHGDHYGVFYPHNFLSLYTTRLAAEAARILERNEEAEELGGYYEVAALDLRESLERGAIKDPEGYRWIPGSAGDPGGGRWGALYAAVPTQLLPVDHELIDGTIRFMEKRISPGGLPLHTGFMVDGMWAGITLDNLAAVYLARHNGDQVAKYLYATLNHATPFYTWCEERGMEAGTPHRSGDDQHLWTPVAVVRLIRDMMVYEEYDFTTGAPSLHLALGVDRSWLVSGQEVGVEEAHTHFGHLDYSMRYDSNNKNVRLLLVPGKDFSKDIPVTVHVRMEEGYVVAEVQNAENAEILPGGETVRFPQVTGPLSPVFVVEKK